MLAGMRRFPLSFALIVAACDGNSSVPLPEPTYVSTHIESEVCSAWVSDHMEAPGAPWTAGASMCETGTLTDAARDDTLARIDLYRYLVDLSSVTEDLAQRDDDQACAVMMSVNDELDHSPPASWDCYSEPGRRGASTSNLAIGTSSPADAIDLFMRDNGVASLGHRRWLINFDLGKVGIGFAENATCLGVFDGSGSSTRTWVAYPPPGPAPIETASSMWSFHASTSLAGAKVTVHRLSDEVQLTVDVSSLPDGYGADAIAIDPIGWDPASGETYRVGVTVPGSAAIVYDVSIVTCGS
jgi:hypothetical protein